MRLLLTTILILPLAACGSPADAGEAVAPKGSGGTRDFAVTGFNRVDLRGSDDVEVTTGGQFAVRAVGDPALLDRLELRRDGDTLIVGRKSGKWRWGGRDKARVLVTMPAIRSGNVAGSGDMTIDRAADGFEGAVAGSGDLNIGAMQGAKASLSVAGSGTIAAAGTVGALELNIAGSGDIAARDLRATAAEVAIAGSGNVIAQVSGNADVSIVGSGNADLGPNARCKVSKLGSGEARCGG